jgi:hypothetical protein
MTAARESATKLSLPSDRERRRFLAGARPTKRLDDYLQRLKQKESKHGHCKHDK